MPALGMLSMADRGDQAFTTADFLEDFDYLWRAFAAEYAYFDEKETNWEKVQQHYRKEVESTSEVGTFISILEKTLEELYDNHVHLTYNTPTSPRIVPSRSDLHAEWRQEGAMVLAVREGFQAALSGVKPGDIILSINNISIAEAVQLRLPISAITPTIELRNWALNKVLAGNRSVSRTLEVARSGKRDFFRLEAGRFDRQYALQHNCQLEARWVSRDFGYISFNDSLGDGSTIFLFDAALEEFSAAKGLVLDLRRAGGGNTGVLEGIAGRLVASRVAYQRTVRPAGEEFISYLEPRGNGPYLQPIVLLVGPWTGSVGEGLAISLSAMNRVRTVGLKMAGLEGGIFHRQLPRTGVGFQITGEKIYNGTIKNGLFCPISRQNYQPDKLVDLTSRAAQSGTDYVREVGVTILNDIIHDMSVEH